MEQPTPTERKRRVDAGVIRRTPRDELALTWLAQMYGAPQDIVAQVCGVTMQRSYAVVQRWTDDKHKAAWAAREKVDAGPAWVWPTLQTARDCLGFDAKHWRPRLGQVAHLRACCETRLALSGTDLEAWEPERKLRFDAPKKEKNVEQPYMPDGKWLGPDGRWWAVEVELTAKGPDRTRRKVRRGIANSEGLLYVAGSAAIAAGVREAGEAVAGASDLKRSRAAELANKLVVVELDDLKEHGAGLVTGHIERMPR